MHSSKNLLLVLTLLALASLVTGHYLTTPSTQNVHVPLKTSKARVCPIGWDTPTSKRATGDIDGDAVLARQREYENRTRARYLAKADYSDARRVKWVFLKNVDGEHQETAESETNFHQEPDWFLPLYDSVVSILLEETGNYEYFVLATHPNPNRKTRDEKQKDVYYIAFTEARFQKDGERIKARIVRETPLIDECVMMSFPPSDGDRDEASGR